MDGSTAHNIVPYSTMTHAKRLGDARLQRGIATVQVDGYDVRKSNNCWVIIGRAIGFELIGGRLDELHGEHNLTYSMIVTVEESPEMVGVIIFIWALLAYVADNYEAVRFRFERTLVFQVWLPESDPARQAT